MRPRDEHDFYPTPIELCRAAINLIPAHFVMPNQPQILDPGCGNGVWGRAIAERYPSAYITGVELRDVPMPNEYHELHRGDFLDLYIPGRYDLVIGNPPYKFAEQFIRKSFDLLHGPGIVLMLLRLAFLEGQARTKGLWAEHPPRRVAVLGRRPSFTGDGKTDATAYALYLWVEPDEARFAPTLSWLDWDYEQLPAATDSAIACTI